jgi:hypothetical protein
VQSQQLQGQLQTQHSPDIGNNNKKKKKEVEDIEKDIQK